MISVKGLHAGYRSGFRRTWCEVLQGVSFEVEQLRRVPVIIDQFPLAASYHSLLYGWFRFPPSKSISAILGECFVSPRCRGVFDDIAETMPVRVRQSREVGQLQHCRAEI